MVKFEPVDPEQISNFQDSHRGRVSYPLLKSFLETGIVCGKIDRTGMQQSKQALYSSLSAYIKNHNLPLKLFSRGGDLYLLRLDTDEEGTIILSPDEAMAGEFENLKQEAASSEEAKPITADEVTRRFDEARDPTR